MEIKEFLQDNYFLFFYALGLIISIVKYKEYFDSPLKHLPMVIAYTLTTEILGLVIRENDEIRLVYADRYAHYNVLIFNIFDIIFFLYFFYVFRKAIANPKFKKWIDYFVVLFVISSLVNPFFQDIMMSPQLLASTIGAWALVTTAVYYLMLSKSQKKVPFQSLLFWISIGLSIFYALYPFILLIGHFDYGLYLKFYIRSLLHVLIAVMHSCFIIGFWSLKRIRPKEK